MQHASPTLRLPRYTTADIPRWQQKYEHITPNESRMEQSPPKLSSELSSIFRDIPGGISPVKLNSDYLLAMDRITKRPIPVLSAVDSKRI